VGLVVCFNYGVIGFSFPLMLYALRAVAVQRFSVHEFHELNELVELQAVLKKVLPSNTVPVGQ